MNERRTIFDVKVRDGRKVIFSAFDTQDLGVIRDILGSSKKVLEYDER